MITSTNPAGRSPAPNPRRTHFTATKDRNIYKAATQALQALMETQDNLSNVLRSAGQNNSPGMNCQAVLEANIPRIPDGFTGQITTTSVSFIESRLGWTLGGTPEGPIPVYKNHTRHFTPYTRGKPSKHGKGTGRGRRRVPSTATAIQTPSLVSCRTETGPGHIKIDKPSVSLSLGLTSLNSGGAAHDANPALDSEEDRWNILDYNEESW
ncbi:hypothetical protein FRC12_014955 [Ceratobasidium sp. 428]|nr:hypothetical protein FRC12_014955 [Ceratobasidium sp. 428]